MPGANPDPLERRLWTLCQGSLANRAAQGQGELFIVHFVSAQAWAAPGSPKPQLHQLQSVLTLLVTQADLGHLRILSFIQREDSSCNVNEVQQ